MAKNRFKVNNTGSPQLEQPVESTKEVVAETTTEEVVGAAKEEQPIVEEPVVTASAQDPVAEPVRKDKKGFTPVYKVELNLVSYTEAMDTSKPIDPEEGGKWQYNLYHTIMAVLNTEGQADFNQEWNTVLQHFFKNKDGIFNENHIYRFPHYWTGSASEFVIFRRIVFLIISTADPATRRKELSFIKLDVATEGLTEAQRNRLINFYA